MDSFKEGNYMVNDLAEQRNEFYPGDVLRSANDGSKFYFYTSNDVIFHIHVLTDKILRVRYTTESVFENDFSYAIDESFKPDHGELEFTEKSDHFRLITERVICIIYKKNSSIKFLNKSGIVLCEDEKGFHWEDNFAEGGNIVKMSKKVFGGEYFYGLGDKASDFNLRDKRFELWGSDTYGYTKNSDPLYKNIPFYLGLHQKLGYGIFFDNSFKTHFDFGKERSTVTSFWSHGGEMNYYFIYGPELLNVVEQYASLTGKPEMPPKWALGYHQCKWSYYPESKVREIATKFRELEIPCDAIYLDIDYMDGFRCFTWDKEKFPKPKKMISDLKKMGLKTIVIIDPGIKIDKEYSVYNEGIKNDYFCHRADGPLMKGSVWPGLCNFPDYTKKDVREWWAKLFKGLIAEDGIKGVWNDMNEPAVFELGTFPSDVRHDYDGNPCSHRKAHNVYGMQMARATYEGVKEFSYPDRPFTITRSGYSGSQRFSSAWTGDNVASWEHIWMANMQCQRLSISGWSFVGSDVGGFIGTPSGEMFVRWVQLATFHPFFRTHSSGDHGDQEPWSFGEEYTLLVKKFIEFRYRLLTYIYTTFWQNVSFGTPMLRPVSFLDQEDPEAYYRMAEFSLGDHLLVCPIVQENAEGRWMYLPQGEWYYYWTDEKFNGMKEVWADAGLDRIPLYIKAGAVIPLDPVMQYVGEKKTDILELHVYYKYGKEISVIYEDEGDGYKNLKENGRKVRNFEWNGYDNHWSLKQKSEGSFKPQYKSFEMHIHGMIAPFDEIFVNNKAIEFKRESEEGKEIIVFKAPVDFSRIEIKYLKSVKSLNLES